MPYNLHPRPWQVLILLINCTRVWEVGVSEEACSWVPLMRALMDVSSLGAHLHPMELQQGLPSPDSPCPAQAVNQQIWSLGKSPLSNRQGGTAGPGAWQTTSILEGWGCTRGGANQNWDVTRQTKTWKNMPDFPTKGLNHMLAKKRKF